MPATAIARWPRPSSWIASRYPRSASGSPQPGHMWWVSVRSSSGFCCPTTFIPTVSVTFPAPGFAGPTTVPSADRSLIAGTRLLDARSREDPLVVGEGRHRRAVVQCEHPLPDQLGVEQGTDP